MGTDYLESAVKQFIFYKLLAEKTFAQLSDEQLLWRFNEDSNSIAMIVNHLAGNMLSRWTDFLTTDGEKEWRDRDAEFEDTIRSREQMMAAWNKGWECVLTALRSLSEGDLSRIIYIRHQGHTVTDAIQRQLAHYAYHAGQIVYIGKMAAGSAWQSLSIPKGQSKKYNEAKFSQPRHREHFTDAFNDHTKEPPAAGAAHSDGH